MITYDRGGRRRIKDRRFFVSKPIGPERRTGLNRRSGWDRRYRRMKGFEISNRRTAAGAIVQ